MWKGGQDEGDQGFLSWGNQQRLYVWVPEMILEDKYEFPGEKIKMHKYKSKYSLWKTMDHMLWLEPSICEGSWGQNHSYKLVSSGKESPTDHTDKFKIHPIWQWGDRQISNRGARDIPDIIRTWFWKDTQRQGGRRTGGMLGRGEVGGSVQGLWQEFRQTNHDLSQDSTRSEEGERDKSENILGVKSEPD